MAKLLKFKLYFWKLYFHINETEAILRDLNYYEPRLDKYGPAMGNAILSVLYARMGDSEKAYKMFKKSYLPNELPPFGVLAETAGGTNPYFATGAGGMLQSVLFGMGGLDITENGIIQLNTNLPKKWKSLKLIGVGISNFFLRRNKPHCKFKLKDKL